MEACWPCLSFEFSLWRESPLSRLSLSVTENSTLAEPGIVKVSPYPRSLPLPLPAANKSASLKAVKLYVVDEEWLISVFLLTAHAQQRSNFIERIDFD